MMTGEEAKWEDDMVLQMMWCSTGPRIPGLSECNSGASGLSFQQSDSGLPDRHGGAASFMQRRIQPWITMTHSVQDLPFSAPLTMKKNNMPVPAVGEVSGSRDRGHHSQALQTTASYWKPWHYSAEANFGSFQAQGQGLGNNQQVAIDQNVYMQGIPNHSGRG
ncbi:zinc finger protein GLI2-like protein [Lates japonicus]|uniref:Zinc finger protein GLI2-like protein n=1 Tax=Lates japonicus TaxID=270547 RepID=A0AAD3R8V0_LATJO|nr:zinc finger protein GLI2-like protein [Lates japonicus]